MWHCQSSPRTWRCFQYRRCYHGGYQVFSTYVEVFRVCRRLTARSIRLLHVRGGVSEYNTLVEKAERSSPRTWRCFSRERPIRSKAGVFSTYVEVFLPQLCTGKPPIRSSPRTWRCFQKKSRPMIAELVFSTYVEVFLAMQYSF